MLHRSLNKRNVAFIVCLFADKFPKRPTQGLITWKNLHDSVPWSLMFLVGSGFAMSGAGKKSGLNAWIAEQMTPLKSLPKFALMMLSCLICQALTEFSSNVAISNIVLPILAGFAKIARVHPMYFMVPAAISCSLAFNTGVGTPPNAIAKQTVFLTGKSLVGILYYICLYRLPFICISR